MCEFMPGLAPPMLALERWCNWYPTANACRSPTWRSSQRPGATVKLACVALPYGTTCENHATPEVTFTNRCVRPLRAKAASAPSGATPIP